MEPFTLYIGKSGKFELPRKKSDKFELPRKKGEDVGLRLVVGILVAGDEQTHINWLNNPIAEALSWYSQQCNVSHLANPHELGKLLQKTSIDQIPEPLKSLHQSVQKVPSYRWCIETFGNTTILRALEHECKRFLGHLRGALYNLLSQHQPAAIIMSMEHDTRPRVSRYSSMQDSVVSTALLWLARYSGNRPAMLQVVAKANSYDYPSTIDLLDPLLEGSKRRILPYPLPVRENSCFFKSVGEDHLGIALADLIANQYGPGGRSKEPLRLNQSIYTSLEQLVQSFKPDQVLVTDGLCTGPLINEILKGDLEIDEAKRKLGDYKKILPRGVLRASIDSSLELLDEIFIKTEMLLQALQNRRGELTPISNDKATEILKEQIPRILDAYFSYRCANVDPESAKQAIYDTIVKSWAESPDVKTIPEAVRFVQATGWNRYIRNIKGDPDLFNPTLTGENFATLERLRWQLLFATPNHQREHAKMFLDYRLGTPEGQRIYNQIQQAISQGHHHLIGALQWVWPTLDREQRYLASRLLYLSEWKSTIHPLPPHLCDLINFLMLDELPSETLAPQRQQDREEE